MKNSEKIMQYWDGTFNVDETKGIQIFLWDRQSGKSTMCIDYMERHPEVNCVVPVLAHSRAYPRHLHNRLFSAQNRSRFPLSRTSLIIDDADCIDDETLYNLCQNYDVKFITLSARTFLQNLMMFNGIDRKVNEEYREAIKGQIRW